MTRVVAVNGSPKMEKGNTERILRPFLEGMKEVGAKVDLLYAKRLDIKPCKGEFYCWNTNPGKCLIKDDMQSVYPLLKRADILVLATPVYIPLPGEMQNFVNRLCPLIDPLLTKRNGRTRARFRSDVKIRKIVLVSTSGWYEKGNFGTVLRIAKEVANDASVQFAGALLRPHAQLLARGGSKADRVLEAAKESGRELVATGRISKRLIEAVGKPLILEEEMWKT
ncbi:MAG: flavodoxin family protein [Thermoplasmatota archaeon]